ncbi:hypothetical protein MM188_003200 [Vibrio cholerae]|nr:hypothetical protein [Vibrio cholerae]
MKAAITTENHYITSPEEWEKTIPKGAIVIIREQGKPESDSLVAHAFCGGFHVWNKNLNILDGEVLEVDWLGDCPKCGYGTAYVETKSKTSKYLYEGDNVHCAECETKGVIEWIEEGLVECSWNEVE